MAIILSSVDSIIVVNIVNRNSGKKLIILRVWLDPLPCCGAAPLLCHASNYLAREDLSTLDYPTVYPTKIHVVSFSQCGQHNPLHDEELKQALKQIKQSPPLHSSCKSILNNNPSALSGYYSINSTNGSTVNSGQSEKEKIELVWRDEVSGHYVVIWKQEREGKQICRVNLKVGKF